MIGVSVAPPTQTSKPLSFNISSAKRAIVVFPFYPPNGGLTFAVAFPLRGSGLVVVASEATRMRTMPVGSLVAEIDAHPVMSLEPLASLNRGPHGVTGSLHDVRFVAKLDVR